MHLSRCLISLSWPCCVDGVSNGSVRDMELFCRLQQWPVDASTEKGISASCFVVIRSTMRIARKWEQLIVLCFIWVAFRVGIVPRDNMIFFGESISRCRLYIEYDRRGDREVIAAFVVPTLGWNSRLVAGRRWERERGRKYNTKSFRLWVLWSEKRKFLPNRNKFTLVAVLWA